MGRRARARRQPMMAREGDLIIDARVGARLLGMPLLTLDAHVVVAPARPALTVRPAGSLLPVPTGDHRRSRRTGGGSATPSPRELARARRLLAEGSSLLDEARRLR
jgi:hypothetical protein